MTTLLAAVVVLTIVGALGVDQPPWSPYYVALPIGLVAAVVARTRAAHRTESAIFGSLFTALLSPAAVAVAARASFLAQHDLLGREKWEAMPWLEAVDVGLVFRYLDLCGAVVAAAALPLLPIVFAAINRAIDLAMSSATARRAAWWIGVAFSVGTLAVLLLAVARFVRDL